MNINLQPNITGTNVKLVRGAIQSDLTNAVNNSRTYRDESEAFSIVSENKSIVATDSANSAYSSATTASTAANTAITKANEANSSAISASASETVCIDKATIATDKADIAIAQAVIATNKASEASTDADTATTQAGISTTKASEASTSASNALISANNADISEANALTYRNEAESFASSVNHSNIVHITGTETITGDKTFSGIVSGLTKATVGLGNVDNESKATMFTSPTFTGTVTLPTTTSIGTISNTELGYLDGVTSAIQTQINSKANNSDVVNITDNQTISGIKTFTSSPIVPTPITDFQVATKKYVDEATKINNIDDLATYMGTLVIVKDINRGGIFVSKTEIDIDPNTGSVYAVNGGTVFAKLGGGFWVRQYSGAVNVKWFGVKGDGVSKEGPTIREVYRKFRFIQWPAGEYLLSFAGAPNSENFVRVYADTTTIFNPGVVILSDPASNSSVLFCNTDRGDTSTTGYNGDGNIHFLGDPEFTISGGVVANMEPFAFVHARNITVVGKGVIRGWTGTHAMEFNACADWKVCGYKFQDQETFTGYESLSECIQWDGAFNEGFPFGPGALDYTPCDNFEISDCEFENVYTAYGAHHTDYGGAKHTRANIRNNTITNAKSDGERLRHLKGGSATGQIINKTAGRATNPRDCVGLYQDGYTITDGANNGGSVVFFQTSQDCVWGPNSVIKYSGDGTRHLRVFETGSTDNPSSNILIHEGICDAGSSVVAPIFWDASAGVTGNKLIGGKAAANLSPDSTLGRFFQSLIVPRLNAGSYLLMAKVSDTSHGVFGRFYARKLSTLGSGSNFNVVEVSSSAGTDGYRRTTWSQNVAIISNLITLVTVDYQGDAWLAIKAPSAANRAFGDAFVFSGFFTDMPGQFTVTTAASISGEVALPASPGITHFSGGLKVDGSTVILANLPISASGLPSGALWRNGVVLNIAP